MRRAHGWIWIFLAILLPALFLAALATRRQATPRNLNLSWEKIR